MPTNKILSNRQNTEQRDDTNASEESEDFGYYDLSVLPPPRRRTADKPFAIPYRCLGSSINRIMLRCVLGIALIYLILQMIPRTGITRNGCKLNEHAMGHAILVWNDEQDREWDLQHCGCVVTTNLDYNKRPIDAVVVYGDRPYSLQGLDVIKHTPNYLVVFAATSPLSLAQNPLFAHADSLFNFTMTYRLDSDLIWTPYHFSTLRDVDKRLEKFDLSEHNLMNSLSPAIRQKLMKKSFLVTYMMYEVNDHTLPESQYLEELRTYIDLDAHESCNEQDLCSHYKFMLIFDPSSCPDYVHPQFYMALENYVVPVLIAGRNLTNLAPPGSYISSTDFNSPKNLANHLKMLAKDPQLYERFFWWHSKYQLQKIGQRYCPLCHQLGRKREQRQPDMFLNWWTQYQCSNRSDRLGWSTK